jgi:tungstate transport system substrate-binding protein
VPLWEQTGVVPQGAPWYIESGTGMLATLLIADQRRAYTLADRGTWLAGRERLTLAIVFERAPELRNIYHTIPVAPLPGLRVNTEGGWACARFFVSTEAQQLIAEFGRERYGQPLFVPAAGRSEAKVLGGR